MSTCTLCPGDTCNGACQEVSFDEYMAACTVPAPAPTAIEPSRVMVLSEDEQWAIVGVFELLPHPLICNRVAYGDEYTDATDELARTTVRKRRLEAEIKRCNMRIEQLTEPVLDALQSVGAKSLNHEASGCRIQRDSAVRLQHRDPDWGSVEKAIAKEAAGDAFKALGGDLGAMLKQEWNHRRVESYFRERYLTRVAAEMEKPEHERQPVDPDDILPAEIRAHYRLNVNPRVKVTQT